jgi:hypothetical protein
MQELRPEERREFQRLRLSAPMPAVLGGVGVAIHEIGVLGARVLQSAPIDDQHPQLQFEYKKREIRIKCDFIRVRPNLESGVRFAGAIGDSADHLRKMLGELVTAAINERRDPNETIIQPPVDGDQTVSRKDAGFLCFRLENGHWTKRSVFLPEQPPSGFTIARAAHTNDMDRLCRLYEQGDDEVRHLVRVFAELSVSDVLQIPPAV